MKNKFRLTKSWWLAVAAVLFLAWWYTQGQQPPDISDKPELAAIDKLSQQQLSLMPQSQIDWLDVLTQNLLSGGVGKDGIPAIDQPKFVASNQADFLSDQHVVFGMLVDGHALAFPQPVMVWHEIVNFSLGQQSLSLTYCPLTGSAIAYQSQIGPISTSFGVSGQLVNSNLVMYDRATQSYWPQILGQAIQGPAKAIKLDWQPVVWTSWARWQAKYPDTRVLSDKTGYLRDYQRDPYGSYQSDSGYYHQGGPLFPVLRQDQRLPAKQVVIGIEQADQHLAVSMDYLRQAGKVEAELAGSQISVVYQPELDSYQVMGLQPGGRHFPVMWFAWSSFFPDTKLVS